MSGPRKGSRFTFCEGRFDDGGNLFLTDREPFGFVKLPDNKIHDVAVGDTLEGLAARYFRGVDDPARYWWVIADFQPEAIIDPTLRLTPGRKLVIPSVRTLVERVFAEARRYEDAAP